MNGSGKAGNGRGNNRRRPFRRRDKDNNTQNQDRQNRGGFSKRGGENPREAKTPFFDRPKWTPPKLNTDPLPVPDCPWCNEPIKDISMAIADRDTDVPVHFECVANRIAAGEILEKGEVITYIGGGRFAVVFFGAAGGETRPAGRRVAGLSVERRGEKARLCEE